MKIRTRKGRENAEENEEENFLFHGVIIPIKSERKTKFVFEAKNNAKNVAKNGKNKSVFSFDNIDVWLTFNKLKK